jgi:hypothetical protein
MRLSAALLCLALGCGKQESSQPAAGSSVGSAAASAGSAASDPWAKPAVTRDAAQVACSDAEIQTHIDASLKVSLAYLTALEAKTRRWGKDCERPKQDLIALEPEATKFMGAMQEFMTWGRTLDPACAKRVAELGDQRPEARDIEARTPGLEAKITPILERCAKHPGFAEAAAKGLRVMHKAKPAP